MTSHLKASAETSYPRRGDFLLRLLRRFLPRRADLLRLFSSRAMLRKARKAVMSKQPELLYISLDAMFFPLLYHCVGGEAPPTRCLIMCSHPDCLTLSALASCLQFTYAAFHRFACDGCYHARTDGGEYLPLPSPYSPATKPGCSAKAGGQWQKVRCLIEYSVFKLHTRRRAEAVTGSGAGAHFDKDALTM